MSNAYSLDPRSWPMANGVSYGILPIQGFADWLDTLTDEALDGLVVVSVAGDSVNVSISWSMNWMKK